ncbi:hypothetical protein EZV62_019335 [Acer yangbiense]|uniref:CCHC-type domain-containing protein n=1 Tax=Acer yangbiense TaxID=1000413 RepID=A0A5C7HB80_9ROSI|nr:hypothetical protein EZV62_019335 [Acer yangbiense]
MIDSEIAKLYENLSLADEDGAIHEPAEDAQLYGVAELDKSDNIVVVGLKYERLPEFCYACGKIGHGIKECLDIEARNEALTGKTTKFGSWIRVTILDRSKIKNQSYTNGSSIDKDRSMEGSCGVEIENSFNTMPGSLMSQKKETAATSAAQRKTVEETSFKTVTINSGPESKPKSVPCLESPPDWNTLPTKVLGETIGLVQPVKEVEINVQCVYPAQKTNGDLADSSFSQPVSSHMVISPKKKIEQKMEIVSKRRFFTTALREIFESH